MENKFYRILFFASIFLIILSFDLAHNPPGGWVKKDLPNLNGRTISDLLFIDSLTGFATAYSETDLNYVLKTTNKGDNWVIEDSLVSLLTKVQFLNLNTGYICGAKIYKTTNSGENWFPVSIPFGIAANDMSVLNEDTIWATDRESSSGGVFLPPTEAQPGRENIMQEEHQIRIRCILQIVD